MPNPCDRMAGRFDDALDFLACGERARIVEHAGLARLDGIAQACGAVALGGPADAGERRARLADIEISDSDKVEPWNALSLCQQHRAELAGADQSHSDRAATGCPLPEHGGKVHVVLPCHGTPELMAGRLRRGHPYGRRSRRHNRVFREDLLARLNSRSGPTVPRSEPGIAFRVHPIEEGADPAPSQAIMRAHQPLGHPRS